MYQSRLLFTAVLLVSLQGVYAQSQGYGFAGATVGNQGLRGAFRYGIGGEWAVAPHVTVGGEAGGIQKGNFGVIASSSVGVHFRRRV